MTDQPAQDPPPERAAYPGEAVPPAAAPAAHVPLIQRVEAIEKRLDDAEQRASQLTGLHNKLADAVISELGL